MVGAEVLISISKVENPVFCATCLYKGGSMDAILSKRRRELSTVS